MNKVFVPGDGSPIGESISKLERVNGAEAARRRHNGKAEFLEAQTGTRHVHGIRNQHNFPDSSLFQNVGGKGRILGRRSGALLKNDGTGWHALPRNEIRHYLRVRPTLPRMEGTARDHDGKAAPFLIQPGSVAATLISRFAQQRNRQGRKRVVHGARQHHDSSGAFVQGRVPAIGRLSGAHHQHRKGRPAEQKQ